MQTPSDNRGTFAEGDTYSSIENLIGSQYDDILRGDSEDNTLTGGAGNDVLFGQSGDDEMHGNAGSDRLYGDTGSDRLSGGGGDDLLHGGDSADILDGGAGADIIVGGAGDDVLEGGTGTDTYAFNANDGTDTLTDNGGNIVFSGGDYTGATYDFAYVDGNVRLTVAKDGSTLNTIEFTNYPVDYNFYTHIGGSQTSIPDASLVLPLRLGSEESPFLASDAADRFAGSSGADWVSYAGSTSEVRVALLTDPATAYFGWADGDRLTGINNLVGSDHDDGLRGNSGDNILRGGAGQDTLVGEAGADILEGGEGDDTLYGGAGEDIYIFARGDGADIIQVDGDGGKLYFRDAEGIGDFLFARTEDGDVVVSVGSDSVTILSSAYADGRYSIHYGADDLALGRLAVTTGEGETRGTSGNDLLVGTDGADILYGGAGDDRLVGVAGDDILTGGDHDDILNGGEGNDILYGDGDNSPGTSNDDPDANRGYNTAVLPEPGKDTLYGGNGDDTLYGQGGNDTLYGGEGDDTLYGGEGDDMLDGGRGVDNYVFGTEFGLDTIKERSGDHKLLLFKNAAGAREFSISYDGDGNVHITTADGHVNILKRSYSNNHYSVYSGENDELLGKLIIGIPGESGSLDGDAGRNWLLGLDYNDRLDGGAGNDILDGGTGEDTYVFKSGDGADVVIDDGGNIVFLQESSNDYVGATYEFTRAAGGSSEAVTFTVKDSSDNILNAIEFANDQLNRFHFSTRDTSGVDTEIILPDVPERVGSESNPFFATENVDTFVGAVGFDWVSYMRSKVDVNINLGENYAYGGYGEGDVLTGINNLIGSDSHDFLIGNSADNILRGGGHLDSLFGGEGADTLDGGDGPDRLWGGEGADTLEGGDGKDTASYNNAGEGVRVDLSNSEAQRDFDGTHGLDANNNEAVGDILESIENIWGSEHDDWLTGNSEDNRFTGGAGADIYTFNAGDGTDTITDDGGKIFFEQGSNDDYTGATYTAVRGQGEAVTITVKDGDDNTLNVLEFTSYPLTGFDFYTRSGDIETEIIIDVPPRLGSEANPFLATEVADSFVGAAGFDWVSYADSAPLGLSNDPGVDIDLSPVAPDLAVVGRGWAVGDRLTGINNLIGSRGNDRLTGNDAANTLLGGEGRDFLLGGEGADTLDGGEGYDTLEGGAGADTLDGGSEYDIISYQGSSTGVRVDLTLKGVAQRDFDEQHGFTANQNEAVGDIISNIEAIRGSNGYDWLTGDENSNDFYGYKGNDRLEGGDGRDFLNGGEGEDILDGGEGAADFASYIDASKGVRVDLSNTGAQQDFDGAAANQNEAVGDTLSNIENILGSIYRDWLTGDDDDNYISGYFGNDRLEGGAGNDRLYGGDQNDILYGGAGDDILVGSNHNDTLYGGAGDDVLSGDEQNDTLYGGEGNDRLYGGDGADTYEFSRDTYGTDTISDDGGRIVFENDGGDYTGATYTAVHGQGGAVTLTVKDSNDNTLNILEFINYPSTGFDFYTRSGNTYTAIFLSISSNQNIFFATPEVDTFTGSVGYDTVSYEGSNIGVSIDLSPAVPDLAVVGNGWAVGDMLTGINNLIGSRSNDIFTGNDAANILRGGAGYDTLEGGAGADTLDGGSEYDTASYQSASREVRVDLSNTGAQRDFDGAAANQNDAVGDTLTNIERVRGSDHNDWLTGDGDRNTLTGEQGNDRLEGGGGRDHLYGGEGEDTLDGGHGVDFLYGGEGADTLEGGGGDDTLYGGEGADVLDGGDGLDTASYYDSSQGVRVDLTLAGMQQDFDGTVANSNDAVGDTLINIENLIGSSYSDRLTGDGDRNTLTGGRGNDRLVGGAGEDTYTFAVGDGTDTIIDDGGDIVFSSTYTNAGYTYASVTYTAVRGQGDAVTLTVRNSNGYTLNTLEFTDYPSTGFDFYMQFGSTYTAIYVYVPPKVGGDGSEEDPFLATNGIDTFTDLIGFDWVSYAGSDAGIVIDLSPAAPDLAIVGRGWADGDMLTGINNLIGSGQDDVLTGNDAANSFRGGEATITLKDARGQTRFMAERERTGLRAVCTTIF